MSSVEQYVPVKQEGVVGLEAGFKVSLFGRLVYGTGAAFNYYYSDKQLQGRIITLMGPLIALVNVPKSRVRGFEGQVTVYPTNGLSLTAAATYLDSKVTSDFINYTIIGTRQNFKRSEEHTSELQSLMRISYSVFSLINKQL